MLTCSIEGCVRPRKSRGWCNAHYERWRIHGDPAPAKEVGYVHAQGDGVCEVDDCIKPAKSRGWCAMHYWRWKKHGDPLATLRPNYGSGRRVMPSGYVEVWVPGHPVANADGYALEHRYVMYELGHDIAGKQVHHIDHDRGNNDPSNLVVMTVAEHMAHHGNIPNAGQFQPRTHCSRGHELSGDNVYTYGDGKRRECYACKRAKWMRGQKTPRRVVVNEKRDAVVAAYVAGDRVKDIAERFGVKPDRVTAWARKAGVPTRRPGRPAGAR